MQKDKLHYERGTVVSNGEPHAPAPLRIGRLVLPAAVREEIVTHLDAARPFEGVGLLAVSLEGSTHTGERIALAERFYPGTNIDASPSRYTMDPAEVLRAMRDIDAQGWTLGAIVHSHVRGPATPSVTDVREARYPESVMLIVSFASASQQMRGWRVEYPTSESSRVARDRRAAPAAGPATSIVFAGASVIPVEIVPGGWLDE